MKTFKYILLLLFLFVPIVAFSQEAWGNLNKHTNIRENNLGFKENKPASFELFSLKNELLDRRLKQSSGQSKIITLPTPMGFQKFAVKEASVLADALAKKYPSIKSYTGVGIDDPTAHVRLSNSHVGVHALISSGKHPMYLVEPYTKDKKVAIGYFKNRADKSNFECLVTERGSNQKGASFHDATIANDGKLRTYKMALIGTAEYAQFHLTNQGIGVNASQTVKKEAVLAAMNTSMTRINGIFERDLGVTMQLVSNNDDLIFFDSATDGLTNDDIGTLIDESQTKCDAVVGSSNYDIGHVFAWVDDQSGNGLAGGGVVCLSGQKAQGVSMRKTPMGDLFDIDLVAHEIGHQFGANHTQNGDCNRNNATAVEPGSGSTIMGYAGFCDSNVQSNSDAYFHNVSIAEMWNYILSNATCATETATNNAIPTANAGGNFTIPKTTPFVLKGMASDADEENTLTYTWEQVDNQVATMPPLASSSVGPLFRSVAPSASADRFMPALSTVLAGAVSSTWEVLPAVARTMRFTFTVRDNVVNGAGVASDETIITVAGDAGPFVVRSQATVTTLKGGSTQTISWDVANTNSTEVGASNVTILLSTDGGNSFPNVLVANTPNDGVEDVVLTNLTTTQARIKIVPVDHIFYAVNAVNFSIDKTTSVTDDAFENFQLYPNPSQGEVTVRFHLKSSDRTVLLKLYDIGGRLISENTYNVPADTFKKKLNFSQVAAGLYHLKVQNGSYRITKKILVE